VNCVFVMKILFLTNNEISNQLIWWLRNKAQEGVTVIKTNISWEMVESYNPEFLISYNYKYIIKEDVLSLLKNRAINLHISFLPWNRGADPNFWSFVENTPKGVTIHVMHTGIDTGPTLLQKEVYFKEEKETLFTSYMILHKEIQTLFASNWDKIKNFQIEPQMQPPGGSIHYKKDLADIKHILGHEGWDVQILELKDRYEQLQRKVI